MEFQTGPKMVRIMIIVFDMMEQKKKSKQLSKGPIIYFMLMADFCLEKERGF